MRSVTALDSRMNKPTSGERMIGNFAQIDPLLDPRWARFVQNHPHGSAFHSTAWLEALRRTYGCQPAAVTTSDSNGHLVNALVFCRVYSWITGRRIVSLPFSDHCAPLVEDEESLASLVATLVNVAQAEKCRYVELRPESRSQGLWRGCRTAKVSISTDWISAQEKTKFSMVFIGVPFREKSGVPRRRG